jgi:hypothetical protein
VLGREIARDECLGDGIEHVLALEEVVDVGVGDAEVVLVGLPVGPVDTWWRDA